MSSSSGQPSKVSFTIRRPAPAGRNGSDSDSSFKVPPLPRHLSGTSTPSSPLARSAPASPKPNARTYVERDSSDEDSEPEDELVTGFDEFGIKRVHEKPKPQGPLVIPALKNKDWRELARKRKQLYVPPSAGVQTGADGSVGGLGTRDTINSGPQVSGLQVKKRIKLEECEDASMQDGEGAHASAETIDVKAEVKPEEETEDQKALRAILSSAASGGDAGIDGPQIDIIPPPPISEDDAYKQDVEELPEPATLDDYERVPVSQFGAALLRGMGWKEGTAASKKGKGLVEPWLPQSRPALLGIGAKEKEVFDDGSKKKGKSRPERRYVPVIKKERSGGESASGREGSSRPRSPGSSRNGSRRPSRSPSPDRRKDKDRDGDRRRDDRDRDRYRDEERDKDKDRERFHERDRRRHDDYDSSRRDRDRDYDSSSRRDRDRRRDRSADNYESSRRKDKY
ncbi:hypothetical protein BN946_scf184790.g15 [Trametes cinnabarina]|uniref:G-patch domain-containing protein n=1 Tax=Pycnoporus cinnabarinus TaxID=5643 RepID=A0A060S395_PYCCI|nr:hypothetical protein BN946_scf184790.g15 [Trametes cinnabarina]